MASHAPRVTRRYSPIVSDQNILSTTDSGSAMPGSGGPAVSSLYDEYYYAHDCGIPYERNQHWMTFFEAIARSISRKLGPQTVLDAGCAMGLLVEQLFLQGMDVRGIDISEYAISQAPDAVRDRVSVASLAEPLEGRYDLVVTVEVIEHIPEADAIRALDNLCAVTDTILFSSSPHDYAEATHINVKTPEQWSALFAERGFFRDVDHDASYLTPWAAVYRRSGGNIVDIVRNYERSLWTVRTENQQLRSSVLDFQRRLSVAESHDLAEARLAHDLAESQFAEALAEARNAVLVSRDRVASLEVRVGEAMGERDRLASLAGSRQDAVRELELMRNSRLWKLVSKLAGPIRRARGR